MKTENISEGEKKKKQQIIPLKTPYRYLRISAISWKYKVQLNCQVTCTQRNLLKSCNASSISGTSLSSAVSCSVSLSPAFFTHQPNFSLLHFFNHFSYHSIALVGFFSFVISRPSYNRCFSVVLQDNCTSFPCTHSTGSQEQTGVSRKRPKDPGGMEWPRLAPAARPCC